LYRKNITRSGVCLCSDPRQDLNHVIFYCPLAIPKSSRLRKFLVDTYSNYLIDIYLILSDPNSKLIQLILVFKIQQFTYLMMILFSSPVHSGSCSQGCPGRVAHRLLTVCKLSASFRNYLMQTRILKHCRTLARIRLSDLYICPDKNADWKNYYFKLFIFRLKILKCNWKGSRAIQLIVIK